MDIDGQSGEDGLRGGARRIIVGVRACLPSVAIVVLAGCGAGSRREIGPDAAADAGQDAAPIDAGHDAAPIDAGSDAGGPVAHCRFGGERPLEPVDPGDPVKGGATLQYLVVVDRTILCDHPNWEDLFAFAWTASEEPGAVAYRFADDEPSLDAAPWVDTAISPTEVEPGGRFFELRFDFSSAPTTLEVLQASCCLSEA